MMPGLEKHAKAIYLVVSCPTNKLKYTRVGGNYF